MSVAKKSLFSLLLLLIACSDKPKMQHFSGYAFDMAYEVKIADPLTPAQIQHIEKLIQETFCTIDAHSNHWNPASEISRINATLPSTSKEHSPHLRDLMQLAENVSILTRGYFNPRLGGSIEAWKKAMPLGRKPSREEIKEAWDFDGIVKGYGIDLIAQGLQKMPVENFLIQWGGELYAHGKHPSGRLWQVRLPHSDEMLILSNQAIATSGNNVQWWDVAGKTYTHLFDPRSGKPIEKRQTQTVSVIGPSCAIADGIATAMMVADHPQDFQIPNYKIIKRSYNPSQKNQQDALPSLSR